MRYHPPFSIWFVKTWKYSVAHEVVRTLTSQ
jgi:hypothetical protein